MAKTILTPITLWKDFDDSLPLNEEIVSEKQSEKFDCKEAYFYGRQTAKARVKIFSRFFTPKGAEEYPAVMVLFEAGLPTDMNFVRYLIERGYGVLCVDYCGDDGTETHTVYPADIDYANYARAGKALTRAEETAKETSWYEWAAVARYGVKYLRAQPRVTKAGCIGMRTGGEVLWKIAPFAPVDCMISVCAAGWLAYQGEGRFGNDGIKTFDEERHRFIAGVESQSYAPYCACPVLLLCAVNDKKYNSDRVYDTFQQINPQTEKAILFSARGSGLMGSRSLVDLNLFLDKHLKDRWIYISKPIGISFGEDENGNLIAKGVFDADGDMQECGIFYTEEIENYRARDWTRVLATEDDVEENTFTCPINVFEGSSRVLAYSFARYTNGFSVTSKIQEFAVAKRYNNTTGKSRILYSCDDELNGFLPYRQRSRAVADCFVAGGRESAKMLPGYGGILGISCEVGLLSYRPGEERYRAPAGVELQFDAYCRTDAVCKVSFLYKDKEYGQLIYTCEQRIEGGGRWKKVNLRANEFKTDTGVSLSDFTRVYAVVFDSDGEMLFNNIIWL